MQESCYRRQPLSADTISPMNTSFYDVHKTFLRGLAARDIAEPLPSFDASAPAPEVRHSMLVARHAVAGVR